MNAGYVSVISELFPNAEIIIDRFQLVQLISKLMNKTRIRAMNKLKTSNGEDMKKYRRLKKFWRLILKSQSDLSSVEYKNYPLFGQRLETTIVEELISYDEELKINYLVYQNLLKAMQSRNFELLIEALDNIKLSTVSSYMKTSIKTLKKYLLHIENSFIYSYSNGRIEGINNKIKVLNRVAYGYRSFSNFRKRIFLHFKLKPRTNKNKQNHLHCRAA